MNNRPASGPSGTAGWAIRQAGAADRPLPILVIPDAGLPDVCYVLPQAPQLARDGADRPVFTLSLVLSERPGPQDDSIFPLVLSAALACDLTLALPDELLADDSLLPLFARQAEFRLLKNTAEADAVPLAEAIGSGAGVRVGMAATLDQTTAQGVLLALQGAESGLTLACRVIYRTADSRRVIHLYGRPADIYDYLNTYTDRSGSFSRAGLQGRLPEMLQTGALKAWRVSPNGLESDLGEADGPALLAAFLKVSGMLLKPATSELDPADADFRYVLGVRPDLAMGLDVRLSVTTAGEAYRNLDAPLEAVLGGALDGLDGESFIHLAYAEPRSRGGMQAAPRRMRSGPPTRDFSPDGRPAPTGLAAVGENLVSVSRALTPNTALRPAATMLLASDAVRPQTGVAHAFVVDNLTLDHVYGGVSNGMWIGPAVEPRLPHLPTVDDADAPLWADRADGSRFWYAPEFSLVPADPSADPDGSTFQFTFHETGHDSQGRTALEGEVLFTLRPGMSAATQAALQAGGNPPAQAVPTRDLSATLSLPVRDDSGQMRQIVLPASIENKGDTVIVRVALLNEYVRVAYGDLAIVGFQPNPAQVKVAYTFEAMVPVYKPDLQLQYAGKLALTPVAYSAVEANVLGERAYLDAAKIAYRAPAADLLFRREIAADKARVLPGGGELVGADRAAPRPVGNVAFSSATLQTVAIAHVSPAPALIRPELETVAVLQDRFWQPYAQQTLGRSATLDAVFPCNTLGAFYRQDLGDRMVSIGCQDSFSLGQTAFKFFELITDSALVSPLYKVYRSLSQPGRFLVLPATYRITRYAAGEGDRAYRPAVYLYSSLDAENQANNRCVVMASLQPDLPPWTRKDLAVKLVRLHHSPVVQYITEIESELNYTWSLSGGPALIEPRAAKLWDSFQVTLSTDLAGGLQLQGMLAHSGVAAQVSFQLADRTTLNTNLLLDLGGLTGPWESGPIETAVQGTTARLTNHIERGVNVSDLATYAAADDSVQTARVDQLLAPGASTTVDLPVGMAEAYPVYALQAGGPADLTEIDSFVEDIHTNVVFVNLINYANHNLKRLDLRARLKEVAGSETSVAISEEQPVGEAPFILPLTTYLGARTLQFQATKTDNSDGVTATAWLEWDLTTRGNVISLTWSLVS
jgi:hypothetical protein